MFMDLDLEMPSGDVPLGDVEHPIIRKACELVHSFPANTIRINAIRDEMVYRFTHGRHRVVAWLEHERGILWICAVDERDDDTYDRFVDLHDHGELLPGEDDARREQVEAATQFVRAVQRSLPSWIAGARADAGKEHRHDLSPGCQIRIFVQPGEPEEIWIALPTLTAPGGGLTPRMRGLVVAIAQDAVEDAEWEERYDWPTGQLPGYEVVYLGVT
jgi:hypothetical protein